MLDQHSRVETRGLSAFEDRCGVGAGYAKRRSSLSLNRWALTIALIKLGSAFAGGAKRIAVVDDHANLPCPRCSRTG